MRGVTFDELYEWISHSHEVEFTWNNTAYVLQPEVKDGISYLVIWDCAPNGECLCRHIIPDHGDIPKADIDAVLNKPCFSGKSFVEVERDIVVDAIS